jgi:hypothetical protein
MGYCAGSNAPGYMNGHPAHMGRGFGAGFGYGGGAYGRGGRGFGRGLGRGFGYGAGRFIGENRYIHNQYSPQDEKRDLEYTADNLQSELDMIRKRIDEIDSTNKDNG